MKRDAALVFVTICAATCIGLGSYCLLDVDEPRFATASRTMLEGGDLIVPHFNGAERFDKPILVYWLQALAMWAFGTTELAARLPSAICVSLASALVAAIASMLGLARQASIIAGLALGTCAQVQIMGHAATADALLLACTTLVAYAQFARARGRLGFSTWAMLWLGLAAALLSKGPPALVPVLSLWLGLRFCSGTRSDWRSTALGIATCAGVVALWAVPAYVRSEGRFLSVGLGKHVLERSLRPFEGHGGFEPWWYLFYFISVPLTFLPWSAFFADIVRILRRPAQRSAGAIEGFPARALLVWIGGTVLVFTIVTSKLPHYPLPAFPALALGFAALWGTELRYPRLAAVALALTGAVVAFVMLFFVLRFDLGFASLAAIALGATALFGFGAAALLVVRRNLSAATRVIVVTSFFVWILLAGGVLRGISEGALHIEKLRHAPTLLFEDRPLLVYRLVMPSIAWYLRREYEQLEGDDSKHAIQGLLERRARVLLREARLADLERAIAASTLSPDERGRLAAMIHAPLWRQRGVLAQKGKLEDLLVLGAP